MWYIARFGIIFPRDDSHFFYIGNLHMNYGHFCYDSNFLKGKLDNNVMAEKILQFTKP